MKDDLAKKGIEKIGFFGSFAKDRAGQVSDIDIAIKLKKSYLDEHDVWEYFRLINTIKSRLFSRFLKEGRYL